MRLPDGISIHIHLILDVGPFVVLLGCHLDFIVKVTDVSNNRHVLHRAHMFDADNVFVACCGDEDVGCFNRIFQRS